MRSSSHFDGCSGLAPVSRRSWGQPETHRSASPRFFRQATSELTKGTSETFAGNPILAIRHRRSFHNPSSSYGGGPQQHGTDAKCFSAADGDDDDWKSRLFAESHV
eukprot:GHVU01206378.1.p1 GENE.GHVU01206378.1~~GHVU01206378.1.p1  ORF type:complete len:106 (+),score=7.01 GHVU01206378.1:199-516(+)